MVQVYGVSRWQVPCLCLGTNARRRLLVFQGQENAFVKDFVSAAEVRKEIAHLFINTNELVVFKNKILGVFKTTISGIN